MTNHVEGCFDAATCPGAFDALGTTPIVIGVAGTNCKTIDTTPCDPPASIGTGYEINGNENQVLCVGTSGVTGNPPCSPPSVRLEIYGGGGVQDTTAACHQDCPGPGADIGVVAVAGHDGAATDDNLAVFAPACAGSDPCGSNDLPVTGDDYDPPPSVWVGTPQVTYGLGGTFPADHEEQATGCLDTCNDHAFGGELITLGAEMTFDDPGRNTFVCVHVWESHGPYCNNDNPEIAIESSDGTTLNFFFIQGVIIPVGIGPGCDAEPCSTNPVPFGPYGVTITDQSGADHNACVWLCDPLSQGLGATVNASPSGGNCSQVTECGPRPLESDGVPEEDGEIGVVIDGNRLCFPTPVTVDNDSPPCDAGTGVLGFGIQVKAVGIPIICF
ncbi:MAG TPA: hypothetical protein VI796_00070 [Candidatus Thermoplasmatota archaeon]|nr:hypothetical protein [Candidatus Thermoplasmatota archaeon]